MSTEAEQDAMTLVQAFAGMPTELDPHPAYEPSETLLASTQGVIVPAREEYIQNDQAID